MEAARQPASDVIDLIDSDDEACQVEPANGLLSQSMSRAASSLVPPFSGTAPSTWDPSTTAPAHVTGQASAGTYLGIGGGREVPASLPPSATAQCPNQKLAEPWDKPAREGASSMGAQLGNGRASSLSRVQSGGSGVPRTNSMALSNTSGNPNAALGQWASSQRSARSLQERESEAGDAVDDSCLTSTWRLPGLGGDWGVEDVDIRIPPLPPGQLFEEEYDVRPLSRFLFMLCLHGGHNCARRAADIT